MVTIAEPASFSGTVRPATALDLARAQGAKITLLHVIDVIYYDLGWLHDGVAIPRDVIGENKDKLRRRLENLLTVDDDSGVELEIEIREGTPYQGILNAAETLEPDLLVIGTHGRRGLSHLFMGSVAERVVQMAACPVLTVKAEGANDEDMGVTKETVAAGHE